MAKYLIFNRVKEAIGFKNVKLMLSGAAPISKKVLDYFMSLNIPIMNTYGMSECAAPTVSFI